MSDEAAPRDLSKDTIDTLADRIVELEDVLAKRDETISRLHLEREAPSTARPMPVHIELPPAIDVDDNDTAYMRGARNIARNIASGIAREIGRIVVADDADVRSGRSGRIRYVAGDEQEGAWVSAWIWVPNTNTNTNTNTNKESTDA